MKPQPLPEGAMILKSRKRGMRVIATYPLTELTSYVGPLKGRRVADSQ